MKKLRYYICMVLCVSMLFCVIPLSGAASSEDYTLGMMRYTDATGNPVTAISPGVLKVSMPVKPNHAAAGDLVFAMILYSGNKMVDSDCTVYQKSDLTSGKELIAQLNVPDGITDARAVTILWNDLKNMKAVCAAGVFPRGENILRRLTVGGAAPEGFQPSVKEYEQYVPIDAKEKPAVLAEAANNASNVKYIGNNSFPGKTQIELTAPDGSAISVYTVTYKTEKSLASGARVVKANGETYVTQDVGKNLHPGDGGDVKDPNRTAENGKLGSRVHWDRAQPANINTGYTNEVRSIADEYKFVEGSDYLMCTAEAGQRANNGYQNYVRLYRSATLYVFSGGAVAADGWELKKGSSPFMVVRNDTTRNLGYVSSRHIEVDNAAAGIDVAIPCETMYNINGNGAKTGEVSITAIVYDPYEKIGDNEVDTTPGPNPTEPPPPTATPAPTDTPSPTEPPQPTSAPEPVKKVTFTKWEDTNNDGIEEETPLTIIDQSTSKETEISGDFKVKSEDSYGSKVFPNRTQPVNDKYTNEVVRIVSDYDFLLGSDYVRSCLAESNLRAPGGVETSFMIYKDTTVYVFAGGVNEEAALENGWTVRTTDINEPYMVIRRDWTDHMTCVMAKKFENVDQTYGTKVVINRQMLTGAVNITVLDDENRPVPQ